MHVHLPNACAAGGDVERVNKTAATTTTITAETTPPIASRRLFRGPSLTLVLI
jgi:hypothetical protein